MILNELICANFDKLTELNTRIGHIKTTIMHVKLSYLASNSPIEIHKVNLSTQIGFSMRSIDRYILRLFVQGLVNKKSEFVENKKRFIVSIPENAPRVKIDFNKLKKLESLTGHLEAAILLSHIAYTQKYKHIYKYSLVEIGKFFSWSKDKVILLLNILESKSLIIRQKLNSIQNQYVINLDYINKKMSPGTKKIEENGSLPVDNYVKSVDKSVYKFEKNKSYPQVNCQKPTSKLPKTDNQGIYTNIQDIKRDIYNNNPEGLIGLEGVISYERAEGLFLINQIPIKQNLDKLKVNKVLPWSTEELFEQLKFSVLKSYRKNNSKSCLHLMRICIKLMRNGDWQVPSGFYESEIGSKYYEHLRQNQLEHEDRKHSYLASGNPLSSLIGNLASKMSIIKPP